MRRKAPQQDLYEDIYCARGDMENRIKECQLDLFADRTSAATMRANQLRLWFASLAYVLMSALRRIGLAGTELAQATCGTIRLKLLKIGALVTISVRRVKIAIASACPLRDVIAAASPGYDNRGLSSTQRPPQATVMRKIRAYPTRYRVADRARSNDRPSVSAAEASACKTAAGRVEEGRGGLGRVASLRFPSPLIKPDVRISRIRLSDWLHLEAHGGAKMNANVAGARRVRRTPPRGEAAGAARGTL